MTDPTPAELLAIAEELARSAGTEALAGRRRLGPGQRAAHATKSNATDPVTEFDTAAERAIVEELVRRRPGDAIVGEEGADRPGTSGLAWHVDPIDGTVNFVYDLPGWSTSIAVVDAAGRTLAGAVYAPVTDELYAATAGGGATLDGRPIAVSATTDLAMTLVATGFNYDPELRATQGARLARMLPHVRDVRRLGSAALDLCAVAAGRVDAYFEERLNTWDVAAGLLIATEAGAVASDFHGGAPTPAQVVAAAPAIHPALLALLADDGR